MRKLIILFFLGSLLMGGRFVSAEQAYSTADTGAKPFRVSPDFKRKFALGFTPIPKQPINEKAWFGLFELLKQNSEFVLHHIHFDWKEFSKSPDVKSAKEWNSMVFVTEMSKRYGLNVFFVLDPLAPNREKLDPKIPKKWKKNFGDQNIRQTFKNVAFRIARDYKPRYIALGSEMNTYFRRYPEDVNRFITLCAETIALIKSISPETFVTVTFQYELMTGKVDGKTDWLLMNAIVNQMDLLSITTYPSIYFVNPEAILADYYSQLKQYTSKPVIVAESGWPTAGKSEFHGSSASQKEFVERFVILTRDLDLRLWIWWFFHDWAGGGYPEFFKSMGLFTSSGNPKPAFQSWQKIYRKW